MIYRFIFLLFLSFPIFAQTIQEKLDFTAKAIKENNYKNIVVYQDDVLEHYKKNNKDLYLDYLVKFSGANSILGNYNKALELNLEVVNLTAIVLGKKHPTYIVSLNNLALNYRNLRNYNKALELNIEVVNLSEKVYGKEHLNYFISLYNLADSYHYLGNYNKALKLNLEVVNLSEKVLGKEHPTYLTFLSLLSSCYRAIGNYSKSLDLDLDVVNLKEKILGKEHPDYLISLNNLALNYGNLGNYNKALELNLEVVNLSERVLGKEHPTYLASLNNLALNYHNLRNYNKALELNIEVVNLSEKVLGKEHSDYLKSLNNLANNYSKLGNYNKALELNLEVVNLSEKVLGKEHPVYLTSLGNLASSYSDLGNYNKALELDLEILKLKKNLLGKEHPSYLITLNNLANDYSNLGNYKKALEIILEVLNISEIVIGKEHPTYFTYLSNLKITYFKLKNYNESDSIYSNLITQKTSTLHEKLIGLDNNLKEIAKNNAIDDYLRFTNYSLLRQKENPDLLNQTFNTWLNLNGLLSNQSEKLRTIVEQSGDKKLLEVYEDWIAQKMQLLKYYELTIDERNKRGIDIKKQQDNIAALEQQLSKKTDAFEEFKKQHSFADIQNKLKENEAYIDIVRLDYYDFNNDKWEDGVRYLVYVITKETKDKPMYIVLNNGKDLETDLITHYLSTNSLANKNNQEKDGVVYNNFWKPIADAIQNKKTIYTVLGGVYNNINLGTIYNPNTGKYLSEELDIRIINSGKSFVQNHKKSTLKTTKQTVSPRRTTCCSFS